jgi:crotonobetaine/carnitine-CoA ligase
VNGGSPASPWEPTPGNGLTFSGVLDAQVSVRADQPLLVIDDVPLTYRALRERSISAANVLVGLGIEPGDRVALFMGTSLDWVTLWFGLCRLGAVAVPINTAYRGDFLANQLRDSNTKMIALDRSLAARVFSIAADVPSLRAVLMREDGKQSADGDADADSDSDSDPGRTALPAHVQVYPIEQLLEGDSSQTTGIPDLVSFPLGAIFSTSGTTGRSKGVLATQHYLLAAAQAMVDLWRLQPGEVVYGPLPLFHLSAVGTVLGPMLAGGTGVLDSTFSVSATWDRVRRYKASGIALAGAMLSMLWNLPPDERDKDIPLRFISAAPVPQESFEAMEDRWQCRVVTCYGMSEAFPMVVAGVDQTNRFGASGRANPNFDVMLFDTEDRPVPVGEVGEVVCRPKRSHVMFEGYDGRDRETVEQVRNLWFHTGDMGRFDEDGYFYFADRKKDAMRRRGENISSFEVEQALLRHPDVAEVAAVGVPSELGEDDVMVYVVAATAEPIDMAAFMDFCAEHLPYFAVPRYVDVTPELPKNAVGRILKHELRARGIPSSAWDREAAGYTVRR